MPKITKIDIDHIHKIEGHAGLIGLFLDGKIKKVKLEVKQGIRLIESILVSRNFEDAPIITARICGVCPVIHNICAIRALENALKIKPSKKTINLRKLMLLGQIIQSHTLHVYFLCLSDFFKYKTTLDLIKRLPKASKWALEVREFGNKLISTIGGRSIHPVATCIGGFKKLPSKENLEKLLNEQPEILKQALNLANLFSYLLYPEFKRKTEFVALTSNKEYAIYDGKVISSSGLEFFPEKMPKEIKEIQYPSEPVKRVLHNSHPVMPGALARINLNYQKLNPSAKKVWQKFGVKLPTYNTFYNIFAQVTEIIHSIEESKKLLQQVIKSNEPVIKKYRIKAGRGIAACEAPRGTLYHDYTIDKKGIITKANIITPTAQFITNLEEDIKKFIPNLKKLNPEARRQKIKMLIRAYDPCMTCSVH